MVARRETTDGTVAPARPASGAMPRFDAAGEMSDEDITRIRKAVDPDGDIEKRLVPIGKPGW